MKLSIFPVPGGTTHGPHSLEVTCVTYALPHATHKWWNPQRLNRWAFIFDQFSKAKTPKDFFALEEKACSNYWRSQTSSAPDWWMANIPDTSHCCACHHQNFERRLVATVMAYGSDFLWLFRTLFLMTIRLYRGIFGEIHALFPEILHFQFVTLFMKHPVHSSNRSSSAPLQTILFSECQSFFLSL